jgi:hypothetical protein
VPNPGFAQRKSGYRVINDDILGNLSSWGGGAFYDADSEKWLMWASEMADHCGMHTWTTNSRTILASSTNGTGIYKRESVVFPIWSHESVVTRVPSTNEYVAFFSYNPDEGPKRKVCTSCTDGSTPEVCKKASPRRVLIENTDPTFMSSSTDGKTWTKPVKVLDKTVVKKMTPMDTNMAAVVLNDSRTLIGMWRDHHPTGKSVPHLVTASDWRNASTYKFSMNDLLFGKKDESTGNKKGHSKTKNPGGLEDMFLWNDKRGNFHALFHQMYKCDTCTAHACSEDGYNWAYTGTAATAFTEYDDGTTEQFGHCERPHLIFDKDGVTPIALTNGVKIQGNSDDDQSFTLLRPLRTQTSDNTKKTLTPNLPVSRTPVPPPPKGFLPRGISQGTQSCAVKGTFFFLPSKKDDPVIMTYSPGTSVWGTIAIPDSVPVLQMLDGVSLVGVSSTDPGTSDFLVVSGGRTKNVVVYDIQNKKWFNAPGMDHAQANTCTVSCRGYWFSMTGDFTKSNSIGKRQLKPKNRRVYRYNLTSGERLENSAKKQRGGAACGCDEAADRVFWAGGFSDSGLTDNIGVWGADPLHRGGEPIFKLSSPKRDLGGTVCGSLFAVVGGTSKKSAQATIDIYMANATASGESYLTLELNSSVISPKVECLKKRYVIISGGDIDGKTLNNDIQWFDSQNLPQKGAMIATLTAPLNLTGDIMSATDSSSGAVMFFDGQRGEILAPL